MDVKFRKTSPHDKQNIKDIAKRVIRLNYTSFLGLEVVDNFINSGMSDREIDDGIDSCTVITVDNIILGFAIVKYDLVHLIMIDVPYQRQGYGGALMSYIENDMFETYDNINLQTFEENKNTVQFYLKHGWKITDSQLISEMDKTMLFFSKTKLKGD